MSYQKVSPAWLSAIAWIANPTDENSLRCTSKRNMLKMCYSVIKDEDNWQEKQKAFQTKNGQGQKNVPSTSGLDDPRLNLILYMYKDTLFVNNSLRGGHSLTGIKQGINETNLLNTSPKCTCRL